MTFARVRALIFVAVLFVTAGVVVIMAINRDTPDSQPTPRTDARPALIPAKHHDAAERDEVTINVFNGTSRTGLAAADRWRVQEPGLQGQQDRRPPPAASRTTRSR